VQVLRKPLKASPLETQPLVAGPSPVIPWGQSGEPKIMLAVDLAGERFALR
jgi:hypothetical protein